MSESTGPTKKQPVTCKVALTERECKLIAISLQTMGYLNLYKRINAIHASFSGPHGPQDQGGL